MRRPLTIPQATETKMDWQNLVLEIEQQIDVKAPLSSAFEGLLRQLTDGNVMPALKLDAFPAVAGIATSAKAPATCGASFK